MTNIQCHYESLKVTRDAPLEVIRAAYRSLSQKHHPDKHSGDQQAAQVMSRINAAYSVLSDAEQRRLYDLEIEQRAREHQYAFADGDEDDFSGRFAASAASEPARPGSRPADVPPQGVRSGAAFIIRRIRQNPTGREAQVAALTLGGMVVALALVSWAMRKEQESMLLLERAALEIPRKAAPPEPQVAAAPQQQAAAPAPGKPAAKAPAADARAATAPAPKPAAAAKAADTAALKPSEYERLTAMLKSMGLGLHKLDQPKQAPPTKQPAASAPAKPAKADKPEKAEKPVAVAKAAPAAPSRSQAAKPAAAPEAAPSREEAERPVALEAKPAAEPARASAAPAAGAGTAAAAARPVPVVDMRSCAPPTYPVNAHRNGESGTVQVALLVGGDGRVVESKIQKSSGWAELDKAARKALSRCSFKVANGDKLAEPIWTRLDYVFSLD